MDAKEIAARSFTAGSAALVKHNYDYAIEMVSQAVRQCPDNVMYVRTLLAAKRAKLGDKPPVGALLLAAAAKRRAQATLYRNSEKWAELATIADLALTDNPWDESFLLDAADAALNLHREAVALFLFEQLLILNGRHFLAARAAARLCEDTKAYGRADQWWARVLAIDPHNGEARSRRTAIAAEAAMARQDEAAAAPPQQENDPSTPLRHAIRKDPQNVSRHMALVEFYRNRGDAPRALEAVSAGLAALRDNEQLLNVRDDLEISKLHSEIEVASSALADAPENTDLRVAHDALKKELNDRRQASLERKIAGSQEPGPKFELGLLLYEQKNYRGAAQLFQQASKDARHKANASYRLALCFAQLGQAPVARKMFEAAIENIASAAPDLQLEIRYQFAIYLLAHDDKTAAAKQFEEIIAIDLNYRDAFDKLTEAQS